MGGDACHRGRRVVGVCLPLTTLFDKIKLGQFSAGEIGGPCAIANKSSTFAPFRNPLWRAIRIA